jgi:hypothetical protein
VNERILSNARPADLRGEHRSKSVPSAAHGLMADVDAALEQHVLDIARRRRLTNVHHDRQPDYLGRRVVVPERVVGFGYAAEAGMRHSPAKPTLV